MSLEFFGSIKRGEKKILNESLIDCVYACVTVLCNALNKETEQYANAYILQC